MRGLLQSQVTGIVSIRHTVTVIMAHNLLIK